MRALGSLLVIVSVALSGAGLAPPAGAETFGYPDALAAPHRPGAPFNEWWVDENGDGIPQLPQELISSRGYYYRNDTDFVAWRLRSLGVLASATRDLHDAGMWPAWATGRAGVLVRDFPIRRSVAVQPGSPGHVAVVEDVLPDGRITISEYNALGGGVGRTWTGAPASRGFTKFLDFGLTSKHVPGSSLAIARNADGRLEVFGVASTGGIWHKWQTGPNGQWSAWAQLEGTLTAVAAETNADGRVELFGTGPDGSVLHKWQLTPGGRWSPWGEMGHTLKSIAVARNRDGRLEIFGANTARTIYHEWQATPGGQWSGWSKLDGALADVAAETNADGRIEVFGVAGNGSVRHKWQRTPGGAWSTWTTIPGKLDSIAVARNLDGRLEVFGTDASRHVFHAWQLTPGGQVSDWSRLDGALADVAADTNADGRIEVFGVAGNGATFHAWQRTPGGSWTPWDRIEGGLRA